MKLLEGFADIDAFAGGYLSIGNFDGVHRGHRTMIARLVERARAAHVPAIVLTFNPHPISILRPEQAPPPLTTLARKAQLLDDCGVDCLIAYPTNRELLDLTPDEFFQNIVLQQLRARGLVEGENFFYGHNRAGNVQTLQQACTAAGLTLDIISSVTVGDRVVSSSAIRKLVAAGDVADAAELLGAPYQVRGLVTHGAARGRTLGFPTANLIQVQTELPLDGVYAGRVTLGDQVFRAAINLGTNPTFAEQQRKFEVHLLDFSGDLYHQSLDVEFIQRLRGTRQFAGIDALKHQLLADLDEVRRVVALVK